jgi:dephospho-CoA kinase
MNQGRIIVITGSPGTGKTTTASIVAKESDMDKSVHMHTDDFFHYLSKGAIPPHLPESNKQNLVVIEAFLEAAKRYARGGYDVKSLSEILGHASVNITMNRYVHPSMDLKRENMQRLSDLLAVK